MKLYEVTLDGKKIIPNSIKMKQNNNMSDLVRFIIPKSNDGIDISQYNVRIELEHETGPKDRIRLEKVQSGDSFLCDWAVERKSLQIAGFLYAEIQLEGSSGEEQPIWQSDSMTIIVEETIRIDDIMIPDTMSELTQWTQQMENLNNRAQEAVGEAANQAETASMHASSAAASATSASASEDKAEESAAKAEESEKATSQAAQSAVASEQNAKISETNTKNSELNAEKSAENAAASEENAKASEITVSNIANNIPQSFANAMTAEMEELETIFLSDQQPDTHMNTFTVYGVSQQDGTPTPDTPAEVVSAEDFDVVCSGKNLINESNQWYDQYGYISSTFADGVWTITNTSGSGQTAQLDIGVLPAGTYAINAVNYGRTMAIFAGSTQIWGSDTFPKTFTLSENREDVRLCAFPGANKSITVSNLQLELGSAATQYTPYIAPYTGHITGAMRGIPKTGGWAFRDYIESDGTSVWKVQECGYAVLTGAESWSVSANTIADGIIFYTILSGQDKSVTPKYSLLSNRFTALKDGSALKLGNISQTNVTFFATPNTDTGITSEDTDAVKLQKYKAWLAENNVTILYQLASPVRTDITETEAGQAILSAVRTKNIVSVRTEYLETNTVNPLYQANYNQDINKVINELKQIIVSLGGVIS